MILRSCQGRESAATTMGCFCVVCLMPLHPCLLSPLWPPLVLLGLDPVGICSKDPFALTELGCVRFLGGSGGWWLERQPVWQLAARPWLSALRVRGPRFRSAPCENPEISAHRWSAGRMAAVALAATRGHRSGKSHGGCPPQLCWGWWATRMNDLARRSQAGW